MHEQWSSWRDSFAAGGLESKIPLLRDFGSQITDSPDLLKTKTMVQAWWNNDVSWIYIPHPGCEDPKHVKIWKKVTVSGWYLVDPRCKFLLFWRSFPPPFLMKKIIPSGWDALSQRKDGSPKMNGAGSMEFYFGGTVKIALSNRYKSIIFSISQ